MASTPTIEGISRIESACRESDQRDYFVPCVRCACFQVLVFGDGSGPGLVWPEGKPEEAMYPGAAWN
jgi:terminase, large subunit